MSSNSKAKKFLEEQGMKLETTSVLTVIDGCMRQPDLCNLLESYHQYRINEDNSNNRFNQDNEDGCGFLYENLH